jgi:hypothetical protein
MRRRREPGGLIVAVGAAWIPLTQFRPMIKALAKYLFGLLHTAIIRELRL